MDYSSKLLSAQSVLRGAKRRAHSAMRLDKITNSDYSVKTNDLKSSTFDRAFDKELFQSQRAVKRRKFKIVNPLTAERTFQETDSRRSLPVQAKYKTEVNTRSTSPNAKISASMLTPELSAQVVKDYLLPMFKNREE